MVVLRQAAVRLMEMDIYLANGTRASLLIREV